MTLRTFLAALLLATMPPCFAQTSPPPAIDAYRASLATVERTKQPVSLEPLYTAAEAAQDALMALQPDGDRAWQETLSESEYAALKASLPGLQLSRGDDVYAQPDGAFLLQLAEAHGRPEDQAFFRIYHQLWGADLLPKYLSAGTRPTPCVRFGEGILPELYADWRAFAARYPAAYTAFTTQTLRDLEEAVGLGVCACGDEQSVVRELKTFIRRFPDTPVAGQVRGRLRELKETPDLRPVRCR